MVARSIMLICQKQLVHQDGLLFWNLGTSVIGPIEKSIQICYNSKWLNIFVGLVL